jgi:hypothetical protein
MVGQSLDLKPPRGKGNDEEEEKEKIRGNGDEAAP